MTTGAKHNSTTLDEKSVEAFFKKQTAQKPVANEKEVSSKAVPPKATPSKPNNFDDVLTGKFKTLEPDDGQEV